MLKSILNIVSLLGCLMFIAAHPMFDFDGAENVQFVQLVPNQRIEAAPDSPFTSVVYQRLPYQATAARQNEVAQTQDIWNLAEREIPIFNADLLQNNVQSFERAEFIGPRILRAPAMRAQSQQPSWKQLAQLSTLLKKLLSSIREIQAEREMTSASAIAWQSPTYILEQPQPYNIEEMQSAPYAAPYTSSYVSPYVSLNEFLTNKLSQIKHNKLQSVQSPAKEIEIELEFAFPCKSCTQNVRNNKAELKKKPAKAASFEVEYIMPLEKSIGAQTFLKPVNKVRQHDAISAALVKDNSKQEKAAPKHEGIFDIIRKMLKNRLENKHETLKISPTKSITIEMEYLPLKSTNIQANETLPKENIIANKFPLVYHKLKDFEKRTLTQSGAHPVKTYELTIDYMPKNETQLNAQDSSTSTTTSEVLNHKRRRLSLDSKYAENEADSHLPLQSTPTTKQQFDTTHAETTQLPNFEIVTDPVKSNDLPTVRQFTTPEPKEFAKPMNGLSNFLNTMNNIHNSLMQNIEPNFHWFDF